MELIPEVLTELFVKRFSNFIKKHVKNTILQKVLFVTGTVLIAAFSFGAAVGVLFLLGFILFRLFKL
jgi:hypothetical protein